MHVAQRLFPADAAALQSIEVDSTVVDPAGGGVGGGVGGGEARGAGVAAAAKVRVYCCAHVLCGSILIPLLLAAVVPLAHALTRAQQAAAADADALSPIEVTSTTSNEVPAKEVSACSTLAISARVGHRVMHLRCHGRPLAAHASCNNSFSAGCAGCGQAAEFRSSGAG